jgi:N-acetylglutamate synthase-like GNAT family acetyltransferase
MNMLVREFEPHDAERLSQLIIQNLRQVNIRDYPQEAIEILESEYTPGEIIEAARHQLTLVCVIGGEVVGTASLDRERARSVFVEVSLHKRGIGKKLVLAIEDYAREQHIKKVFLLSGLSAQGFYEKLGYTVVRRFDNDLDGIPLSVVHMEKELVADRVEG